MLSYRLLFTGLDGQTSGSATVISAETDDDALMMAIRLTTAERGGELWQGSRLLCRLPPIPAKSLAI